MASIADSPLGLDAINIPVKEAVDFINKEFKQAIDFSVTDQIKPKTLLDNEYLSLQKESTDLLNEFENYRIEQKRNIKASSLVYKDIGKEIFQMEIPVNDEKHLVIPDDYIVMSRTKVCLKPACN